MRPDVSIDLIVPVYKNAALTRDCVNSILKHLDEIEDFSPRVILINDSPDDEDVRQVLDAASAESKAVIILENEKNLGFVKSVNKGLAISRSERRDVILINSDTQTFPGTLKNLLEVAYIDPQIGFASPRSNNAALCSFPHLPHAFGGLLPTPDEAYERWQIAGRTLPKFHFAPTAVGFYLYIKHKMLALFEGLREDFGLGYEEENDLIMRANKVGFRAAIANHSFAYHAGSASFALRDLDIESQKNTNLRKLMGIHPEFIPLVRRYESSPHYRAERLMGLLIPGPDGKHKIAIDLLQLGCFYNGTSEQAVAVVKQIWERWRSKFDLTLLCSKEALEFHGLDELNLPRADMSGLGSYAIVIRLGQPFEVHHINVPEVCAPINIFGMLDVIAEDCGHLSISQHLEDFWGHIAKHANGFFYISEFSKQTFLNRFPDSIDVQSYTKLLPTRKASYEAREMSGRKEHVLVLGNHFAHKASDSTARVLSRAYPHVQFVSIGGETSQSGNLASYRSGLLDEELVARLYADASVIVLPSHVEGFGFGMMRAIATRTPVIARDIPPTREILSCFADHTGVFLYESEEELLATLPQAMLAQTSTADDRDCHGWEEWVDGLMKLCEDTLRAPDIFETMRDRIRSGDALRKTLGFYEHEKRAAHPSIPQAQVTSESVPQNTQAASQLTQEARIGNYKVCATVDELLSEDGERFVGALYATLLRRPPDTNGLENYVARLKVGVPKLQIIDEVRSSAEGREKSVAVIGLREALANEVKGKKNKWSRFAWLNKSQ
jgi:GT2 family glycosyltransferase